MKIALLSEKYTPDIGGLAISAGRLGELLASAGHEVRVFAPTTNLSASTRQNLVANKVRVMRFGAHKRTDDTLVDWFELIAEEHKRTPFDLLHAYFLPQAGFVAAYAGKYLNIPSVVSIRGNDIERAAFDPSKFSHVMYALQNASAVTTNASELAKKANAFIDREIFLIPNGVNTKIFKKVERNKILAESLRMDSRKRSVIGFAGELRSKKGLSTLLIGYAQINKRQPATLLIVGDVRAGEYQQAFEEFQHGNPDTHIIVTGYIPHKDMPAYYSLMDVFVHPSLRDGMPNAVLEAMACELPVVATPVGGILDMMKDNVNGKTVPVKDVDAFVNITAKLLNDEETRKRLGQSARETIVERFTLEKELEANLNLYKTLNTRYPKTGK
jgi:glycosyltransferase involved in cell wall biosynthesis